MHICPVEIVAAASALRVMPWLVTWLIDLHRLPVLRFEVLHA